MLAIKGTTLTDGVVVLREIRPGDAEDLYRWRMHPVSLPMFRNTEMVPYSSHSAMIERYFDSDSQDCWFIIEVSGEAVGTLSLYNFEDGGRTCEWGRFTIAPESRNRGYGRRALHLLLEYARSLAVRSVHCDVLSTNAVALRIYRELGFAPVGGFEEGGRRFITLAAGLGARV